MNASSGMGMVGAIVWMVVSAASDAALLFFEDFI